MFSVDQYLMSLQHHKKLSGGQRQTSAELE